MTPQDDPATPPYAAGAPSPEPRSVLLVDDEEGIRRVLSISLLDLGYDVLTAPDAEEALRLFREHTPAIVLTDIKMPGMDGVELLKRIKAERPETEVIMITGHGDMETAIESLKHEAADFITKPIHHDSLEISLARVQEKMSLKRQLEHYTRNLEQLVEEKSARIVELERQTAISQVIEGVASAMEHLASDVDEDDELFTELPCYITIHNAYLEIVASNALYRLRFGDRVGASSCSLYADEHAREADCPVGRTFATGMPQRKRALVQADDGEAIPMVCHTAPIYSEAEDVELVLEIWVDVSEVEAIRQELARTRARYRHLFETAPLAIAVRDQRHAIRESNRRFKEDFGPDGAALAQLKPSPRAHNEEPLPERELLARALEALKSPLDAAEMHSRRAEFSLTTPEGPRHYYILAAPLAGAPASEQGAQHPEIMELIADITEVREMQDHLASLGLLLGSMSHGVKGMLTALDGGVYRLESGLKRENMTQVHEAVATVKQLVGRVRATVLDILRYAKSRELNVERVAGPLFAQSVASLVEPRAAKAGVNFVKRFDHGVGELEIDATALSTALVNLLENAVDACAMADASEHDDAREHTVTFTLEPTQRPGRVRFRIQDDGVGMDAETRDKLFTLFFSSKGPKGTGLGLFITQRVVAQHKGTIEVDSEPGRGAVFTVELPTRQPETEPSAPSGSQAS